MENQMLDIIVPTHNTWENSGLRLTTNCIEKLYWYTKTPFQLIVVDDSTDITPLLFEHPEFKKRHLNITFVHSDIPFKCGNQFFNLGLKYCEHEFVAMVMNSITVQPDWEVMALQVLQNNPKVGVVGLKCLFPAERGGLIECAGIMMHDFSPIDIGRDMPPHAMSMVRECPATQWAFAIVRKEAVVGNLDEEIYNGFVGWDDIDNCFTINSKGWKILYCGLGAGYHEPRATRGNNSPEAARLNKQNAETFYKRWGLWEKYQKSKEKVNAN